VQTTDLPGAGTVRSVVGSMGVPLYPAEPDAGYALTKARARRTSCLRTAVQSCTRQLQQVNRPYVPYVGPDLQANKVGTMSHGALTLSAAAVWKLLTG